MSHALLNDAVQTLIQIEAEGLLKRERRILTPQSAVVTTVNRIPAQTPRC